MRRALGHGSGTSPPCYWRSITALAVPRCANLFAFIFLELPCEMILLLLRDVVVELYRRPRIRIVIVLKLITLCNSRRSEVCEVALLEDAGNIAMLDSKECVAFGECCSG